MTHLWLTRNPPAYAGGFYSEGATRPIQARSVSDGIAPADDPPAYAGGFYSEGATRRIQARSGSDGTCGRNHCGFAARRRAAQISHATGSTDTSTMPTTTSSKFFFTNGNSPKK